MNPISIVEWNINQQGGTGAGVIPHWVKDEINGFDIVVLTEFCGTGTCSNGRNKFIADLESYGYQCAASENPPGCNRIGSRNDILIAVKSTRLSIRQVSWVPCYDSNRDLDSIPENLRVDIDCGGSLLSVIGIRIKALDNYKLRKQEFLWVMDQIREIENPIIITGDFNNFRRGTTERSWNKTVIHELSMKERFNLHTPKGSSITKEHPPKEYEFPEDHFLVRNAEICEPVYDRSFTRRDKSIYRWGRDFCEQWQRGTNQEAVKPPFPDHAILKGTLYFPVQKE